MHRGSKLRAKTEETYPDHTGGNSGDATYGKVKFTYDPAGRMIRREDQKGDTVTFNHTMAGTITSRNYRTKANSPSGTIADSDTFTFDNLGRMLTAVSGRYTNTVTMTYDSYGRLKDESLTLAGQTYTVTRAYDTRSRLTQLTYPNGSIVQRTYTNRSQLHTVRYLGTTVDTRTYDDGGRLGTSTYANGAVVSFAYRNDNLPTSIATTHCRGSLRDPILLPGSNYRPAARHCRGSLRDPILVRGANHYTSTGYDDEDRLQTWNRTNGTLNQAWTLSAVGNWNNFTSAGSTWNRTHSNAHEFTGFTGASTGTLAYDVKGNQTSRPSTLSAPALNLDWNFDNQLRGADTNGSAGSLEVTFEYDALGRRVSRSHSSGNVVYVHAGQQVIADYARGTAAASPTYRYVYADYVDEPIVRHTGTATTLPTTGDIALYYHRNQQYSIIGLTNAAGTLVERYSYTAYGTLGIYDASGTVRTTSTYANRYTYTGREYDPDLNLYHFRARWYDPSIGGFISRDPMGYVDGMSLYRGYLQVDKTDPTGTLLVANDDLWWRIRDDDRRITTSSDGVRDRYVYTPQQVEQVDDMCTNNGWCFCATRAYVRSRSFKNEFRVGYELKWTIEGEWVRDTSYISSELPSFRYYEWWDFRIGRNSFNPGGDRYDGTTPRSWWEFQVDAAESFFNGQANSPETAATGKRNPENTGITPCAIYDHCQGNYAIDKKTGKPVNLPTSLTFMDHPGMNVQGANGANPWFMKARFMLVIENKCPGCKLKKIFVRASFDANNGNFFGDGRDGDGFNGFEPDGPDWKFN